MSFRTLLMLAALAATAVPACVVHTMEPGAVTADGSVYLGFNLYSADGKTERDAYPVGDRHGAFRSIRVVADDDVVIGKVGVVFSNGERAVLSERMELRAGQSSHQMMLPGGPRAIHSVVMDARSKRKKLANIEVYGAR